jgi:hypothetical protein
MPTSMRKNILQLGISPTGGLPAMACESSQTTGGKQEEAPPRAEARPVRAESSHNFTSITLNLSPTRQVAVSIQGEPQ